MLNNDDSPSSPKKTKEMEDISYYKALGLLIWLQDTTHPDLFFSINLLSCFAHNPGKAYWNTLKLVLCYVKEILDYEITYHANRKLDLYGYINSDFSGDKNIQRSIEGNMFFVAGRPVS